MLSKITVLLCLCLALAVDSKSGLKNVKGVVSSRSSSPCAGDSDTILHAAQTAALQQSANCSASAFIKAVEQIYIYSAEYVYQALQVVTKIGVHFTRCPLELIPVNIMECVFHGLLELPAEIDTLVDVTYKYLDSILSLVSPLVSDIESCFRNSTQNYQLVLKANVCDDSLTA